MDRVLTKMLHFKQQAQERGTVCVPCSVEVAEAQRDGGPACGHTAGGDRALNSSKALNSSGDLQLLFILC